MGEKRRGWQVWPWVIVAVPVSLILQSTLLVLAVYWAFYEGDTEAEARRVLTAWSVGLQRCGERDGELPLSTKPIPASLQSINGKKYQAGPTDWREPAHTCSGFSVSQPQRFQYSWLRQTAQEGVLTAVASNSGGRPGVTLEVAITCQNGRCSSNAAALADAAAARERSLKRSAHDAAVDLGESEGKKSVKYSLPALASLGGFIWLIVAGFSASVGWGMAVSLVPCVGALAFTITHWQDAKGPFLTWFAGWGMTMAAAFLTPSADEPAKAPAAATEATTDTAATPQRRAPAPPPPVPSAAPIGALEGEPVDLSTLMGRARKLANAWQPEAALLSIEATLLDGNVQPQAGGTAKLSYGPSPFAATPSASGLFVVTYDKQGIASGPAKGVAGKALAEPMCAPEGLQASLQDLKGTAYTVRYALAADQRPAWLVTSPAQPKLVRVFDPQTCGGRASNPLRNAR